MGTFAPGDRFGEFEIRGVLGTGERGAVYDVVAPGKKRRALKVLDGDVALTSPLHARFRQEAEAIASVDHPGAVRFHGADVHAGRGYIVMERVEGMNLAQLLEVVGGKLPVDQAVRIFRPVAGALAALHARGIAHRDVRPEHILVGEDDVAKLGGFHWAKPARYGVETALGQVVGSAHYKAPEAMTPHAADPRSDVYALALCLYRALAGVNPMAPAGASLGDICSRQVRFDPPQLAHLDLGIPGDLSDVVRVSLCKDPAGRLTPGTFAAALERVEERLDARRRAAACNMPVPNGDPRLAATEPSTPSTRGDAVASGPPVPEAPPTQREGAAASLPATPAPPGRPAATIRMEALSGPAERRSTAIPGERPTAATGGGGPRRMGPALAVAALLLLGGGVMAVRWGPASRTAEAAAEAPASAAPAAAASAPPATAAPVAGSAEAPRAAPAASGSASALRAKPAAATGTARQRAKPGTPRLP